MARALANVLARWYVLSQMPDDVSTPDIDGIASAILLPDAAVPIAVGQFGYDIDAIASWLVIPRDIIEERLRDSSPVPRSGLYSRAAT